MSRADQPIIDEPVEDFGIADMFLSRTDERGIILYGNSTFHRISGYDWPELINVPHKIVRHPDMPRTAFWLVWKMLKEGRTCGAYVKNRAKNGRYYWVYAVLVPVEGGYLSVRLKPTTEYLGIVQDIYLDMLAQERKGTDLETCGTLLDEAVKSHGFRGYPAFMGYALGAELSARATALGRRVDPSIAEFETMGNLLMDIAEEVTNVRRNFEHIKDSPKNLSILGSRLTTGREPMQVVAQNYELLSQEMLGLIVELSEALERLLDRAYQGRMGHCASLLYGEAIEDFATNEPNRETHGHADELKFLRSALAQFCEAARKGCDEIGVEAARFVELNTRLGKLLSGLAVTRVICRIETASVDDDTESIEEITTRLSKFQEELGRSLDRIGSLSDSLQTHVPGRRASAA